jgi:hypothetical protein
VRYIEISQPATAVYQHDHRCRRTLIGWQPQIDKLLRRIPIGNPYVCLAVIELRDVHIRLLPGCISRARKFRLKGNQTQARQ